MTISSEAARTQPTEAGPARSGSGGHFSVNVGQTERLGSLVAGGLLASYGLAKRSPVGLLLAVAGGAVALRGATGHCGVYQKLGLSTASGRQPSDPKAFSARGTHVDVSVTVDRSPDELYRFWRDFQNLPRFMSHLRSVTATGSRTSRWVTAGPAGVDVAWESEVIADVPGETIAWRSLARGDVDTAGSVRFLPAPDGRGTRVRVLMDYVPPFGRAGVAVAKLFGRSAEADLRDDLARFKQLMEAGTGVA